MSAISAAETGSFHGFDLIHHSVQPDAAGGRALARSRRLMKRNDMTRLSDCWKDTPDVRVLTRRDLMSTAAATGLAFVMNDVHAQTAKGRWHREADLPWAVQEVYGTLASGRAVIVGGMMVDGDRSRAISRVGIFDPVTRAWTEGEELPSPRHHPAVAFVNGRLYAIGGARHGLAGEPDGDHWRQQTDVFVLENGSWHRGPSLPAAQSEGVVVAHDGKIHLMTGRTALSPMSTRWSEQRDTDFHQVLDTADGRWTFAAPAPVPRNSAGGGVIDGLFYVVGGRTMQGGNMARLDRYDPGADRWETLRPMPKAAGGLAVAVLGSHLHAFGGEELETEGPDGVIAQAWRYSPATDRWEALPDMPTPRHGLAAVAIDNRILLIGGGALPATGRTTRVTESFVPT